MATAIYNPYIDRYGNPKPDISEEGLQWVSEHDDEESAHAQFCDEVGIDGEEYGVEDFCFVSLPAGASAWESARVNEYALEATTL